MFYVYFLYQIKIANGSNGWHRFTTLLSYLLFALTHGFDNTNDSAEADLLSFSFTRRTESIAYNDVE